MRVPHLHRVAIAALALGAYVAGVLPSWANAADENNAQLALNLFNTQSCAQHYADDAPAVVAQASSPSPAPPGTPAPPATPAPPNMPPGAANGTFQVNPTPHPLPGHTAAPTPPPIPGTTPNPTSSFEPVFLVRGGETPPPISPAGQATPRPTPEPTGAPTLAPGNIAVISDQWSGNRGRGQPSDAIGNVHIYFGDEEIVGQRAHFDGVRMMTISGHPFLVNHEHNSVFNADIILFDTVAQTATLENGHGASDEGVQRGLVHFSAADLHTDPDGTAHGSNPYITTCENPRGGYHITGKDMEVYPGDKIVVHKAVLWLGAAAIFYLPLLIIPLRNVDSGP